MQFRGLLARVASARRSLCAGLRGGGSCGRLRRALRFARNCVRRAIVHEEARGFFAIEWAGAASAEYGNLIAAFVHSAIAVNTFRHCKRWAAGAVRGDQLGRGPRAETVRVGRIFRR